MYSQKVGISLYKTEICKYVFSRKLHLKHFGDKKPIICKSKSSASASFTDKGSMAHCMNGCMHYS